MNLSELCSMDKDKRSKLTKAELLSVLDKDGWLFGNRERENEDLRGKLAKAKSPYDQAKMLLIGATGKEVQLDEWSKKPNLEGVDLCELIGILMANNQKLLAGKG